jgi:hypothetical protein
MSVSTTQYVRKPLYVDAVRITNGNFEEIAEWCQGEIKHDEVSGTGTGKKYIKIRVHNPKNPRQTMAFVGDWLLYTERGYKVYTNKAFHASFDERSVVEATEEPRTYPFNDDGGMTIIGPECFAQPDGTVLSWKGVNYIPQNGNGVSIQEAVDAAHQQEKEAEKAT